MKRLTALLFGVALCVGLVGSANAQVMTGTQRWTSQPLRWITTANGAVLDSATFRTVGTQTTYDTTVAFPLSVCEMPNNVMLANAASDTVNFFTVRIGPSATS